MMFDEDELYTKVAVLYEIYITLLFKLFLTSKYTRALHWEKKILNIYVKR
jgi:hypothetical protein